MIMSNYQQRRGVILAISGASLWGVSGVASQFLFNQVGVSPIWLVGIRLMLGGLLALLLALWNPTTRCSVWQIWVKPKTRKQLILFSLFGFLPSQTAYFMSINYGNVATAAALQFLSPAFTIIYLLLFKHLLPKLVELITIIISIIGTVLLVTNGNFTMFVVTPLAIFWGLISGIGQVSYSILPKPLLDNYDSKIVVGWGMFLGGLPLLPNVMLTNLPTISLMGWFDIAFVVIAGTLLACLFYISSLNYIFPAVAQMLGSFEPLTAAGCSILVLNQQFGIIEIIGMLMIISVVFIQALGKHA
ncbi:DMT family transporter [Lactobacillaceae bacterium Scapto_B20]